MLIYNLDASALINGFYKKDSLNIMAESIVTELKDIKTEILLNNCIDEGILKLESVEEEYYERLNEILLSSGDLMRLSDNDKDVVALAIKYMQMGHDVITVTDDYSMQNVLKILNLKYRSVNTRGISDTIKWKKICKGCKKEYPADTQEIDCIICGSPLIRKRDKARRNY